MRLALSLRAQRTRDELKELLTALANSGHGELVKLVTLLLQRISPPATMDMVADCWPDLDAALIAVTALAPPTGSKPPKPARRGFRFWG